MFSALLSFLVFAAPANADVRSYDIKGMTCSACAKMVKAKVCELPGLDKCEVSVGKVTLAGKKLDDEAVKAAIAAAGEYTVVGIEHADAAQGQNIKPQPGPTLKTGSKKGKN